VQENPTEIHISIPPPLWLDSPLGDLGLVIVRRFTITLRHTTFNKTPLDEGPARRRDLYLTTHNTHKTDIHAPGGIFFFFTNSWVFPFDPFLFCITSFFVLSCHLRSTTVFLQHNTTSMPPVGFEPTILVSERPKTHAFDRTATGIGMGFELTILVSERPQTHALDLTATGIGLSKVLVSRKQTRTSNIFDILTQDSFRHMQCTCGPFSKELDQYLAPSLTSH
jgi:hypothetical protein